MRIIKKIHDLKLYKKLWLWAHEKKTLTLKDVREAIEESRITPAVKERILAIHLNPSYYSYMNIEGVRGWGKLQEVVKELLSWCVTPKKPVKVIRKKKRKKKKLKYNYYKKVRKKKKVKPPKVKVPRKRKEAFMSRVFTKEELKNLK